MNRNQKKIKIKNEEINTLLDIENIEFPKYVTQLLNLANQNAQGTRPKMVGQMSDLIQQFSGKSIGEWEKWYRNKHPTALEDAVEKIFPMVENLKDAVNKIDKEMVKDWVKDLIIAKTFAGLCFQEAILKKVAEVENTKYRLADPHEESQGIDGYIGDTPVSIKPVTYKQMDRVRETISCRIIFYEKKKDGILIYL